MSVLAGAAATIATGAPSTGMFASVTSNPYLEVGMELGVELVVVAVLVVIAGLSNGAANGVLLFVVLLWLLAGISALPTNIGSYVNKSGG